MEFVTFAEQVLDRFGIELLEGCSLIENLINAPETFIFLSGW
jgi:hypothetical protein